MNRVEFELAKIDLYNSPAEFFTQTWKDVQMQLYEDSDFGLQLLRSNKFLIKDMQNVKKSI